MTRKLVPVLIAIALGCPQAVSALALGDIKVRSALNEPLDAEIELVSVRGDELADLRAGIASTEEFRRAGVERPYLLSRLRFRVEEKAGGKAVLRVSTRQPVKEPFLNFLVEINWPQGRLVREYTALLDPPVYGAAASAGVRGPVVRAEPEAVVPPPVEAPSVQAAPSEPGPVVATEPAPAAPTPAPVAEEVVFAPAPAPAPVAREAAPAPAVAGRDAYGPTRAGDTLWGIANRVRPDASITTQQMMVALRRANPDAFAMDNVNALKTGYVLKVPDRQAVDAVGQAEAIADLRRQQTAWDDFRQGVARTARPAPVASALPQPERKPAAEPAPTSVAATEPKARLEVVGAGAGEGGGSRRGQTAALKKDLALLQEDADARRQEVSELRSRLLEAEALIQDLQRLIKLKDESLAALQQQAVVALAQGEGTALEPGRRGASEGQAASAAPAVTPVAPAPAPGVTSAMTPPVAPRPAAELTPTLVAVPPAESKPAEAATPTPRPPAPVVPPAPVPAETALPAAPSLLESLTANPTVFWGGLAGLLAIVGGLLSIRRRRPVEEAPALARVAAVEEPSTTVGTVVLTEPSLAEGSVSEPSRAPARLEPRTEESRAEDPMAEVNVYLAYERFDQAEALVRRAIEENPDRPEYRLKLLEVHHAAKNPETFERDLDGLRKAVGDEDPLMERARILWSEIAPGHVLLGAGGLAAAVAATAFAGQPEAVFERTLRLSADEIRAAVESADVPSTPVAEVDAGTEVPSGEIDFDLGLEGPAEEPASGSLDFDLDLASEAPAEKDASTISTVDLEVLPDEMMASALAEATQALDLDLTEESAQESAERPSGSLDFDLEETFEPSAAAAGDSPSGAREPSVDLALEPLSVSGGKTALAGTPPVGLAAAPTGKTPPAQVEETGFDLEPGPREAGAADSTETQAEPTSTSTGARAEEAAAESEVAGLDLALEPLETSSGSSRGPTIVPSEGIPEEVLATLASGSRAAAVAAAGAGKAAPSEVDFELDLDLGGGDADESSFFLEGEGIGLLDEVGTKLDLARAYIDMGDTEGARGILSEVLSEGNDVQRLEARDLLGKLAS